MPNKCMVTLINFLIFVWIVCKKSFVAQKSLFFLCSLILEEFQTK